MLLAVLSLVFGLALLVWSADKFVEGAASTAKHPGMSSLLIGMVVIGFGTSTPELVELTERGFLQAPENVYQPDSGVCAAGVADRLTPF